MPRWTTADMPRLTGRSAIVTGANSGLGFATCVELARAGASVVMACRREESGTAALSRLLAAVPGARAELRLLDLASLESVHAFADAYGAEGRPLELLVNNAGVMALPYARTADGFEMQLGTNHLGHFALTARLLPALMARPASRVVTVSSVAHRMGTINFDDLQSERSYQKWAAYGQSKLANLLFTYELQRRSAAAGSSLLALAAHPGYAATNLQARGPRLTGSRVGLAVTGVSNAIFGQSAAQGALPTLRAATDPDLPGGTYVGPAGLFHTRGAPVVVRPNAAARDEEVARRLWEVSEELTGVRVDFSTSR